MNELSAAAASHLWKPASPIVKSATVGRPSADARAFPLLPRLFALRSRSIPGCGGRAHP